jgi:hypothetical protein
VRGGFASSKLQIVANQWLVGAVKVNQTKKTMREKLRPIQVNPTYSKQIQVKNDCDSGCWISANYGHLTIRVETGRGGARRSERKPED